MVFPSTFLESFPSFGAATAIELPAVVPKLTGEAPTDATAIAAAPPTATNDEPAAWTGYLSSFSWSGSIVQHSVKDPHATETDSKNGASDASVISDITQQRGNISSSSRLATRIQDVIPEGAEGESIEVEAASVMPRRKLSKTRKVSFDADAKDHMTTELAKLMKKRRKSMSKARKNRKEKKNELKKYLKKSLKAYLKEAGPKATPQNVEEEMMRLEKAVGIMVTTAVKKENSKQNGQCEEAASVGITTLEEVSYGSHPVVIGPRTLSARLGAESLPAFQPSYDVSAMSSFQKRMQSEMDDLSTVSAGGMFDNPVPPPKNNAPTTASVEDKINELTEELATLETMSSAASSATPEVAIKQLIVLERKLSELSSQLEEPVLRRSASKEAATRWESYMTALRAKRGATEKVTLAATPEVSTAVAKLAPTTTPTAQSDEERHLKMAMLEKEIAQESLKISMAMAEARESYLFQIDENENKNKCDETRDLPSIEEDTAEENIKFHLPLQASSTPEIQPSQSVLSASTAMSSAEQFEMAEEIQAEIAKLKAIQSKFTYDMNMEAYAKRRPTILKSDVFSKSVFKESPPRTAEEETINIQIQEEMNRLRSAQAELFAKGRELTHQI